MEQLKFTLPVFEGPLDLLLHLIEKNKVDIYDIPIAMITDQYFEYLNNMPNTNLDIMSDFLVMAATLLDIKARMLLPANEEIDNTEDDPRRELVERLLEYKKYKYIGSELKDMSVGTFQNYYRGEHLPEEVAKYKPPIDLDKIMNGVTLEKLTEILKDVASRSHERVNEAVKNYGRMQHETIPIEVCIENVRSSVKGGKKRSFRKILESGTSKTEIIVTFLAILELLKIGEIKLTEDSTTDDFTLEENDGQEQSDN